MFDFPHGLDLDDEGNVWVADQLGHRVVKFDAEGNLLLPIGERGTAGDPPLLNEPTDVVVASTGEVFITEGHSFAPGANRVPVQMKQPRGGGAARARRRRRRPSP